MELVYLWVEDYKNIHDQGFNFSGRYRCDYNPDTNKLTIDENTDYIHIFPDNINVTAIVGENGKGKSNLLEYLILNSLHHVQNKMLSVSKDKDTFFVNLYGFDHLKTTDRSSMIKNNTSLKDKCESYLIFEDTKGAPQRNSFHALSNYELIYYSISPFDRCNVYQKFHRFNYLGILNENGEFAVRDILVKQIKAFVSLSNNIVLKNIIASLELAVPNKILLNPLDHFYLDEKIGEKIADFFGFTDLKQQTEFGRMLSKQYNTYRREMANFSTSTYHPHYIITDEHKRPQSLDMDKVKNFLYIHFFIETVKMSLSNSLSKAVYEEQITLFIDQYKKEDDVISAIKSFFSDGIHDNAGTHPNSGIHMFIDKFCQISIVEINSFAYFKSSIHNQFTIELNQIDDSFLALFKATDMMDAFELSWLNENMHVRLSSGEIAIIDMLFNITVTLQQAIQDHKSKFLLIFDEIELFLHPKWQRKYLNNIIKAVDSVLEGKQCDILLTSHSPFILSDIPNNCVNFIGANFSHKQTFGANIHTLLSDAFFMNDGLMGEFAREKIETIKKFYEKVKDKNNNIKDLKEEYEQTKDTFTNIQSIIGEPFLKTIMGNYLDELHLIFSDEKTLIDKKLIELEKRKQHLESLKNVKN